MIIQIKYFVISLNCPYGISPIFDELSSFS